MSLSPAETLHVLLPEHAPEHGSALDVALELQLGVPAEAVDALRARTGLGLADILAVVSMSNSTLKRRRQRAERLSPEASDALFRLLHIFRAAEAVLGSGDRARRWLITPSRALGHHRPLDLLTGSLGARLVEEELAALEHGFLA